MTIVPIPPEIQDDEQLRWMRRVSLEREELRTLRLVLEYERLKFDEARRNFQKEKIANLSFLCAIDKFDSAVQTDSHKNSQSNSTQTTAPCTPTRVAAVDATAQTAKSARRPVAEVQTQTERTPKAERRPLTLRLEATALVVVEADGELRRELRRAVEKGERREREMAELRAELARKTEELDCLSFSKENFNFQWDGRQMMGQSADTGSVELREAALAVAMERLREREREFEEFVASEERRLEAERSRLGRKKEEVIYREKKLLSSHQQLA